MATIKPNITIVPSIACKGITAFTLPFLRIPNSTNRITAEIMKQILQMKTILEKKRKAGNYELKNVNGELSKVNSQNIDICIGKL